MSLYVQTNQPVTITNAATYAVNAADTGKILLIPALLQGCVVTLPALAAGLHYRFINTVAVIGFNVNIRGVAASNIRGILAIVGATPVSAQQAAAAGSTSVNYLTAASVQGDSIDLYCDGIQWTALGYGAVAASLSFTA